MNRRCIPAALLAVLITMPTASAVAGEDETDRASTLLRLVQEESEQTLFLRCCWARGRAGFHYCEEYGICDSDREAVCHGTGAAEGRTLACREEPPALPEGG
ncbi:MAG: hypothetical protein PVG91_01640 [Gammaproteobacteria bacterium]